MLDQIENISTTFDKLADGQSFMKEQLTKIKFQYKIEFENSLIAMSKNGGMIAFIKRHTYFIMDQQNPLKENIRIFFQDGSQEQRIRFKNDSKDDYLVLFDFTEEEQLIGISAKGTIYKFDIFSKRITTKETGNVFKAEPIETAKLFEKGFVALTKEGQFFIIRTFKEPLPALFYPMQTFLKFKTVKDFLFVPADKTSSKKIELFFPNTNGFGVFHFVEQSDNNFGVGVGIKIIRSDNDETYNPEATDTSGSSTDLKSIIAFALSPSGQHFAMYRNDGAVFIFSSDMQESRQQVYFKCGEKDSKKDQDEQMAVLEFPQNTQLLFCGEDAVCLCGKRFIFLVTTNSKGKCLTYKMYPKVIQSLTMSTQYMRCISEVDGLRVLMPDGVFFISKVPDDMYQACFTFSEDPSKKLITAYKSAEEKKANCDKEIRDISGRLPDAVKSLQNASANIWKTDVQLYMLKAAQHGKNFVQKEEFNFDQFVEVCKNIRIINNLRASDKPRFITYQEYKALKPKNLINRLIKTQDFYLAFEISKYLDLNVKKVYQKFAIAQMKLLPDSLSESEELEHYRLIQKKLEKIENISYIKLAEKAFKYQKKTMGINFLNEEKSVLTKIPQYLELKSWNKAIELALETYDSSVLLTVIDKILKAESFKEFGQIIGKYKRADSTVLEYLKRNLPDQIEEVLLEKKSYEELFFYFLEKFFNSKTITDRRELIGKVKEYRKKLEDEKNPNFDYKFYKTYVEDLEQSIHFKKSLLEDNIIKQTDISPFDNSIYDVYYTAIKEGKWGIVEEKNKKNFQLSPAKLSMVRLKAYAEVKNTQGIMAIASDPKLSGGLTPINFVEVFLECGLKERIPEFIEKVTDPDYFDYKVEILKYIEKYSEALEVIIKDKDCERKAEMINEILQKKPDLNSKVKELLQKYNVKL